jgi:imidazolonepropionase-like amidohydrolase
VSALVHRVARFAGLAGLAAVGAVAFTGAGRAQTIAITNARILPVAGPPIERGTLVMRDGKIAAVGANVPVPAGAQVIDGTGKTVTPGFLNSDTQVGIVEIDAVSESNDTGSGNDQITAAFDVTWGLNPNSTLIPIERTGGITRAVVAPAARAGLIAGQGAVIRLAGDRTSQMVDRPRVAMFGVLDQGAAAQAGGSREDAVLRIRELLEDARDYAAHRSAYESRDRRDYSASRLDLEALVPVVQGKMLLALNVNRAADIENALQLARDYKLKLILLGAAEGWEVADDIAHAGVPVVMDPLTDIPDFDQLGATLENAARMAKAGVQLAFATFDASNARNVRFLAGNAVSYGMPYDAALRAVTVNPARIWGIAEHYGTLEPGKDADVVVWTGDPFELLSYAQHVFIQGREMPGDNRQQELLDRYRTLNGPLPPQYKH